MSEDHKLSKDFFCRNTVQVAQDLLGKTLVFGSTVGIITETEAYTGHNDEASHAHKGPTPRSLIMFGEPGYSYVYFIYGMYHCLNIVTEATGQPGAVLIRGLQLPTHHLNGPGKLCKVLGITKEHHGLNLVSHPTFYVCERSDPVTYQATPRIGIKKATDKLWRFVMTQT